MKFRSPAPSISEAYAQKRHLPVMREFKPASAVCDSCWAQGQCTLLYLKGERPLTCCVSDFFDKTSAATVDTLVEYTCATACVKRQQWAHDDVPHDASYCEMHCPVSRFLRGFGPSNYA